MARNSDPRIVVDSNIHHGQPVIAGTRVPVAIIVGGLTGGMSSEEIQAQYRLTENQVRAAVEFDAKEKSS